MLQWSETLKQLIFPLAVHTDTEYNNIVYIKVSGLEC